MLALSKSSGLCLETLQSVVCKAELGLVRGVGPVTLARLCEAGVDSVAQLAAQEPQMLQLLLRQNGARPPNLALIEDWILQARRHSWRGERTRACLSGDNKEENSVIRILIVDGNHPIRHMLAELLRLKGYEVDEAVDGLQALESFATRPSDVVLMDIHLPRLNGWEACRRLREHSRVPILMTSTYQHSAMREQTLACGANALIPKPLPLESLLSWLGIASQGGCQAPGVQATSCPICNV
jgi:CheY-like chemotaxis protein